MKIIFFLLIFAWSCGLKKSQDPEFNEPKSKKALPFAGRSFENACPLSPVPLEEGIVQYATVGAHAKPFSRVAKIFLTDQWMCSGVLVGSDKLITSAHCFEQSRQIKKIIFSLVPLNTPNGLTKESQAYRADSVKLHPDYQQALKLGMSLKDSPHLASVDLAIIRLDRPVGGLTSSDIMTEQYPPAGSLVAIVGYGDAGRGIGNKRFAWSHVGGYVEGAEIGAGYYRNIMLLQSQTGSGACPGDSGGGVFRKNGDGFMLMGIISGINDALYPGFPIESCSVCPKGLGVITLLQGHERFLKENL